MSTYAEVINANPSYSAKRYAKRLPYAIIAPAVAGLAIILLFFFVPWFSTGEPATSVSNAKLASPKNVSAITVGTTGVNFAETVVKNDNSGSSHVTDSYSFPLIWAIPVVGLIQIVLALLVLKDRILTRVLALSIRLSFLAAIVFELLFFISSYFLAFGGIKGAGGQIATFPVMGFWFSFVITLLTALVTLLVMPDLQWCWTLARNDIAREVRIVELRESHAR
ncbi:MAG TPA: hypothetical protein VJO32_04930 [Ktedonobacteraceae bacterium]|nr:hypothetical protein [Ktedonobacteraceae bacterium]